jgi:hypothetical protein
MEICTAILELLLHAARRKDVEKPVGTFLQLRSAHFKSGRSGEIISNQLTLVVHIDNI